MSRKKHKKDKKKDKDLDYLIPKIEFPIEEEEEDTEYDDPLLCILEKRIEMVMDVLQSLKENGAESTDVYGQYAAELHMMIALGNIHEQLIQYEDFDGEDDDEDDE